MMASVIPEPPLVDDDDGTPELPLVDDNDGIPKPSLDYDGMHDDGGIPDDLIHYSMLR